MALKQRIDDDLKTALLERNRFETEVLRGLKAAILNEEVALKKREEGLGDSETEKIIAREVKKRFEAADLYEQNDRAELANDERKEAEILQRYLPKQLSESEITKIVEQVMAELGASDMKSMGAVIGAVKQRVGNTADGAIVARIVKENLSKQV